MALALRSPTSFINPIDPKGLKNLDHCRTAGPAMVTMPTTKASSFRVRASISTQEQTSSREKITPFEVINRIDELEKVHAPLGVHENNGFTVPVFVMMPLDTITPAGNLNKPRAINASLKALKSAGVEGVMMDVWWGLVERDGPTKYNWEAYAEVVEMVKNHGLKLQAVMSFHQCGGNVGDSCFIPLPPWVLEEIGKDPDLVYTDRSDRRNPEYLSLGCDSMPVLKGRTPIQAYSDYMRSFRDRFREELGRTIVEVQVGMGPCGELRYPAYPESNGTWRFPGIGEFQCYDKYMKASLQSAAEAIGKREWGNRGPDDAGNYNQFPEDTGFFRREGTWTTEYGYFFLNWYSSKLIEHGDKILSSAKGVFQETGVKLSGKVAGIHWHYRTRSHAPELTAGYNNTRCHDGYQPIAQMMAKHDVVLNFTCMEMKDYEQPEHANCSPEGLVQQVKMAVSTAGGELAGENALPRYDPSAFGQVLATSQSDSGNGLGAFTYLRMNKNLFEGDNWRNLVDFVRSMSEGGRRARISEDDCKGTDLYVGHISRETRKNLKKVLWF